ncbi:glyceraldehyde-3-phosphate dehydrogenase [Aspergillus arachidicola]|uniref:Glyceraldehyde-3-phosphate dehydrogenase n=1 Tax=Aspergillus arachidicola TaxID=656916 RepID=A0A2G7FSL1_9EURO|nr:glyceraldehyde-3-phosphate dehydrogenase [Aspergillus arachidicola]
MAPSISDFPHGVASTQPSVCKVGINGFGRIGRNVLRASLTRTDLQIVAINHTCNTVQDLIYLIRYDSCMGKLSDDISIHALSDTLITINGRQIVLTSERDLQKLNWSAVGVDYVVECTGKFTKRDLALQHVTYGHAKRVVISAPSSDSPTYVYGVNSDDYTADEDRRVVSCASCTTNCVTPVLKVLHQQFGIVQGLLTTVHAATQSQQVLDGYSKKNRRLGRSVFDNIIPTTTGAAKAIATVLPELTGKVTGVSIRVPAPNVSMIDLTVTTEQPTSLAEIMAAFRRAAKSSLAGVLYVSDEELVSSDYKGNPNSAVVDAPACTELNPQPCQNIKQHRLPKMDILPNELILLVGQYITDDAFSKLALSKCSRRLQWLFDPPTVYSSLHISSIGTREVALIQYLWRRPDLAHLVHDANFGFARCIHPYYPYLLPKACTLRWNSTIEHIVDDICESEREKTAWNTQLRQFCEDAWLGVLLSLLNNLKSITLGYGGNQWLLTSILDKALLGRRPFSTTAPFPLLQKVTLKNYQGRFSYNPHFALGWFHLPAVRTIEGVNMWDSSGRMDVGYVEYLDKPPCLKLERFKVDIGVISDAPSPYIFDPRDFRQGLAPCKKTLKALSIGFHSSYRRFRARHRTMEVRHHLGLEDLPFGSFREFIVLEHLSMRHANLMRLPGVNTGDSHDAAPQSLVDLSPTSLKSLEITDVVHAFVLHLIAELSLLVTQHTTIIPQFERIVFYLQQPEWRLAMFLTDNLNPDQRTASGVMLK